MSTINCRRTPSELEARAIKYWPPELSAKVAELSTVPLLIQKLDQFFAILTEDFSELEELYERIEQNGIAGNMFVKELAYLADIGGEKLERVSRDSQTLFPDGRLHYFWKGEPRTYEFKAIMGRQISNSSMKIDGKGLIKEVPLNDQMKDAIALILFGSFSEDDNIAGQFQSSEVATYIGNPNDLKKYMLSRYIQVSRITGGSTANALGHIAEEYVREFLRKNLEAEDVEIVRRSTIPGIVHRTDREDLPTSFDVVLRKEDRYAAVEVSFQVTTNSTVERKAGQVRSRFEQMEGKGYKMAYVIDGAGNFERQSALSTICSYSHCTVAFSDDELNVLLEFLRGYFT